MRSWEDVAMTTSSRDDLRFSLRVNNDLTVEQLIALVTQAEDLGFSQLWVSHDLFFRSAPVALAVLARETSTIRIGSAVLNPYSLHPAEIAMVAATMQEVSEGRFLLGLAAGAADFLSWIGIDQRHPLIAVENAVTAIRVLLAGNKPADYDFAGAAWRDGAYLRVPPIPTPIYIGGMSPKMLALAGRLGDGVLALLYPPEHYFSARLQIDVGVAQRQKDLGQLDLPACIWCSVDEEPRRARLALAKKIAYYGPAMAPSLLAPAGLVPGDFLPLRAALERGDDEAVLDRCSESMLALGVAGSAETVVERCRSLLATGATHISFGPPLGPDLVTAVDILGRQVVPQLRAVD